RISSGHPVGGNLDVLVVLGGLRSGWRPILNQRALGAGLVTAIAQRAPYDDRHIVAYPPFEGGTEHHLVDATFGTHYAVGPCCGGLQITGCLGVRAGEIDARDVAV